MKIVRLRCLIAILSIISGCLNTVDIQTQVKPDASVARRLEFVMKDDQERGFRQVFHLPHGSPWRVRRFEDKDRESGDRVVHHVLTKGCPATDARQSDFTVHPFKADTNLGKYEGRNEWRVTRRRSLFHTTYLYEESLRFPGLRGAYESELSKVVQGGLQREFELSASQSRRLQAEIVRAAKSALDEQTPLGRGKDFVSLLASSLAQTLDSLRPQGWAGHPDRIQRLYTILKEGHQEFLVRHSREGNEDSSQDRSLYTFQVALPGTVTRTNGLILEGNRVLWKNVLGLECQFRDYTLFAESRVDHPNWSALLSLGVILGLPAAGMIVFFG